jgi:hypothetical protein
VQNFGANRSFGEAGRPAKKFKDLLTNKSKNNAEAVKFIASLDETSFNETTSLNSENATRYLSICNRLKEKYVEFSLNDCKAIFEKSYEEVFTDKAAWNACNFSQVLNCISEDESGKFIISEFSDFKKEFLKFSLMYYIKVEKFRYFAVIKNDFSEIVIIDAENIESTNLQALGLDLVFPSLQSTAGQGNKPGIKFN